MYEKRHLFRKLFLNRLDTICASNRSSSRLPGRLRLMRVGVYSGRRLTSTRRPWCPNGANTTNKNGISTSSGWRRCKVATIGGRNWASSRAPGPSTETAPSPVARRRSKSVHQPATAALLRWRPAMRPPRSPTTQQLAAPHHDEDDVDRRQSMVVLHLFLICHVLSCTRSYC